MILSYSNIFVERKEIQSKRQGFGENEVCCEKVEFELIFPVAVPLKRGT